MASWDFTIDSEKQKDLAEKLSTAADNFDTKVTALYGQIDSMNGTSWIGEDYDTFHTGVHNYEGALNDLSDSFRMFSEHYKLMADGTDTLATELIGIINNMTGKSDESAPGGEAPVTPSDSYYDGEYTHGGGSNPGSGAGRNDVTGDEGSENGSSNPENTDPDPVSSTGDRDAYLENESQTDSETGEESTNPQLTSPEVDAPTDTGNASSSSATVGRGSVIQLGNGNYSYYGTTKKGTNLYTDSDGYLYYEDSNGNAVNVTRYDYSSGANVNSNYVNCKASEIGQNLSYYGAQTSIGVNINGEYIASQKSISDSIYYENSSMAPNVVTTVTAGENSGSTYIAGATDMESVIVPTQKSEFIQAIKNHSDMKIPASVTLKYDPSGILNTQTLTNGEDHLYLRYDAETGLYYKADVNGSYSTSSAGYDPSVFTNGDSSIKFND